MDKVGRKSLLMSGSLLMATSIMILGIVGTLTKIGITNDHFTHYQPISVENNITENATDGIWEIHPLQEDSYDGKEILEKTAETIIFATNIPSSNLTEDLEDNINKSLSTYADLQRIYDTNNTKSIQQLTGNKSFTNFITEGLVNATHNTPEVMNSHQVSLAVKITSVIALMVFVCAYGMSYGPGTYKGRFFLPIITNESFKSACYHLL